MSTAAQPNGQVREIRPVRTDEWPEFVDQMDLAFHENPPQEEKDVWARLMRDDSRTVTVREDGELIGTAGAFEFRMTVPGGVAVPTAGVTFVTVKPTHRRRGVLTDMMRHQLHGLHEAGREPLATLFASESAIYGRFGYGLSAQGLCLAVLRSAHALPSVPDSDKYRLRLVDPRESYEACAAVFDANAAWRPGMVPRDERFKEFALFDHESVRDGAGPMRCVVAEDPDGTVAGYARYRVKEDDGTQGRPQNKVMVQEAYGRETASYIAVWRYLLDLDLTAETHTNWWGVPTDDALWHLLADPRGAQPKLHDSLYTRLVDVDKALAARRYAAPVDVVLEVADDFCPWNAGRWRLTGDRSGAACERTNAPADLKLGARELGAAYLGGVTLAALSRAALVEQLTAGSLAAASTAFSSDTAPYAPYVF